MNMLDDFAGNAELRMGLREPFPASLIQKVPATERRPALDYVSHAAITDRLNKVCPAWTYEITKFADFTGADGLPHVMAVYGWMQIGTVMRFEVGESDGLADYGRELKGAISNFIRRAAMRFGVGIDLWAKEDLHVALSAALGESTANVNTGPGSVRPPSRDTVSAQAASVPAGKPGTDGAASPPLSVLPGGGSTDVAAPDQGDDRVGEGRTTPPGAASTYLSKEEQKELISDYGSSKIVVAEFQKHFGDRIRRMADITCEMVEAMNS